MQRRLHGSVVRRSRAGFSAAFLGLLAAAALFGYGCAGGRNIKSNYLDVLYDWTRKTEVYSGVESRLYLYATYKSDAFRQAYVDQYASSYLLGEDYKRGLLNRENEEGQKYNVFFMAAYTPVDTWNDFDRPNSSWRLYMEDDSGEKLSPVSIKKVDSSDPLIRQLFPYFDLWSSGYIVRFPKYSASGAEPIPGPETKSIRLIATGVLGEGSLEWRFNK